ncbi:MAG: TerD family protein [Rhodospirillales bacterium]|nr:TerD family protein [Rhodospirillales bacterium]MCB9972967.1 TerD family protein [Rhodospirillales bacterium]MCB9980045.1 TerD family protein [Rhodospirillales bacterium]
MKISLPKGRSALLPHTQSGRERVTIGLSWDTPEIMPERPETFISQLDDSGDVYEDDIEISVGFVQETYDLDLVCLIYNRERVLIDAVSPAPEETVDLSGAIYHTGDDTEGISAGDDEQVSVELANLPEDVTYLVFLAIIQSGHTFGQLLNTACRVADGKTDSDILNFFLAKDGEDGANKTACALIALSKDEAAQWHIRNISEYRVDKDVEDWGLEAASLIRS